MNDDRYRATLQALFDAVASRTAMRKDSDGGFWFNGFASKAIKDAMRDADAVLARSAENRGTDK